MSTDTAPAPNDWNAAVIKEFRANGGHVGGRFEGSPMILVHHVGARTGTPRVTPLVYFPDGERMVIAASKGGAPTNPDWYYNVTANPQLTVEVAGADGVDEIPVTAVELTGEDRDDVWQRLVAAMPGFGEYQQGLERVIPLIGLTRTA